MCISLAATEPDGVVLKVPVDELEVPMLEAALVFAVEHKERLGAAARAYVEREHALSRVGRSAKATEASLAEAQKKTGISSGPVLPTLPEDVALQKRVLPRLNMTQLFYLDPDGIAVECNFPAAETPAR